MNEPLAVTVLRCARCRQDHTDLIFKQFDNPVVDPDGTIWSHWATCPVLLDPVLLRRDYADKEKLRHE